MFLFISLIIFSNLFPALFLRFLVGFGADRMQVAEGVKSRSKADALRRRMGRGTWRRGGGRGWGVGRVKWRQRKRKEGMGEKMVK